MKIFASTLGVLLSAAPVYGQSSMIESAYEMLRASQNLEDAVTSFTAGNLGVQPSCADPTGNYVHCITMPDEIDETRFISHPVVPSDLTLGDLKGTPDYDLGLGMISAMRDASTECDETGLMNLATYTWLSEEDGTTPVKVTAVVTDFEADTSFGSSEIEVWNTFADDHATGGVQVVYDYSKTVANSDLEFPGFPMNMPPMEGGFYDIDVSANTITYVLKDNRSASNILFPEGTFDTYYFLMPAKVASVSVVSSDDIVVETSILEDGASFETMDAFGTGLVFPESFGDNVLRVQIVGGTDLKELGQVIEIEYSLDIDMEPIICASGPLVEDVIEMEPLKPTQMHDIIPEFKWTEAPPGVDYDFYGSLEMCGGLATQMDWPAYFANEETSGAIFAYRQYGLHQGMECGDEMAPVMHLQRGKTYKINFINSSESDTNLHTHGLHLGGNGWSDDVFRAIPAGMCGVYYWEIHPDHISGMHWYHPHLHEWTFEQVRGRAFGPLFVDEPDEVRATYPPSVQKWLDSTILVQLSTETVPAPMTNGDGVKDGRCPGGYDDCYPRANNKRQETIVLVKDEWTSVFLHSVVPNGTGMDVVRFFGPGGDGEAPCVTMIAGYDGVYRSSVPRAVEDYPEEPNYFHANGASRLHLAIKCSGDATMKFAKEDTTDMHYGLKSDDEAHMIPVVLVIKTVEGEVTEASPYADEATLEQWIPPRPEYLADLTQYTGPVEPWEIKTEIAGMGGSMWDLVPLFNGKSFHGGEANHVATYEAVQEWSYYGSAAHPDGHPMHVHVNHVQIYGHSNETGLDCGPNLEYGQWYDTLRIKKEEWDPCLARFKFNDYSGKIIMHCHDLLHEDGGMMGWVMVEGGPNDEEALEAVKEPVECTNIL